MGLPRWLRGKESTCNAGVTGERGSIPESGRSPGGGQGYPLQYSCLENPMDRGAWWATVHSITKSRTWLKWLSIHKEGCRFWIATKLVIELFFFLWYIRANHMEGFFVVVFSRFVIFPTTFLSTKPPVNTYSEQNRVLSKWKIPQLFISSCVQNSTVTTENFSTWFHIMLKGSTFLLNPVQNLTDKHIFYEKSVRKFRHL